MKKNLTKAMVMGMVLTMLGATAVFANEAEAPVLISENEAEEEVMLISETEVQAMFLNQTGTVTMVDEMDADGNVVVTMDNEQGGLRFVISPKTVVLDRATGAYTTADALTEGMAVAVVFDANNPMGMSMPPFMGNVAAVVANADQGTYTVGNFDAELTDMQAMLQLNIGEETQIVNTTGSRQIMTAEDVKGQNALVFYDFTTRSIPAQTTPSFVLVLQQEVPVVEEAETEEETAMPELVEASFVPLRDMAEKMGFTVKWQGKDKPVLLEKDDVSMEVTMNAASYSVNGETAEASMKAELIDGVMYVSDEIFA